MYGGLFEVIECAFVATYTIPVNNGAGFWVSFEDSYTWDRCFLSRAMHITEAVSICTANPDRWSSTRTTLMTKIITVFSQIVSSRAGNHPAAQAM
jgi:hypothetical protein